WSVEPPAPHGTIRLIGRSGFHSCATDKDVPSKSADALPARINSSRPFIGSSLTACGPDISVTHAARLRPPAGPVNHQVTIQLSANDCVTAKICHVPRWIGIAHLHQTAHSEPTG